VDPVDPDSDPVRTEAKIHHVLQKLFGDLFDDDNKRVFRLEISKVFFSTITSIIIQISADNLLEKFEFSHKYTRNLQNRMFSFSAKREI
jgi:hypothetical protein